MPPPWAASSASGDLDGQVYQLVGGNGRAVQAIFESLSFEQFHGDEGPALMLANSIDGTDIGMVQGGEGVGFLAEALRNATLLAEFEGKELERDETIQLEVFGAEDHAHSAAAQFFEHLVMGDRLAWQIAAVTGAVGR